MKRDAYKNHDIKKLGFKAKVVGIGSMGQKILGKRTVYKNKDTGEKLVKIGGEFYTAHTRKNPYTNEQMAYITESVVF